ncbi:MAG: hypothetical protein JO006_06655 [Paucibacter sp.]|nr:hypothetical protein [Roseateles sp.]
MSTEAFAAAEARDWAVPLALQHEMYDQALKLAKQKVRGGPNDPVYKKPFVDAAFSGSIYLWDTCFIATYAKFHPKELPIANALDNFYQRQDADGFICREYKADGTPYWPKSHPVSINPPLLAFAELELFGETGDLERLKTVYPKLVRFFDFLAANYRGEDHLYFSDSLGSGMDNIPRYPSGWRDDGHGIRFSNPLFYWVIYGDLDAKWNRQGRSVDMSAQMVLFANNLSEIAQHIGQNTDIQRLRISAKETSDAINAHCWNEDDGFYYDLGYGKHIPRRHIGMFWTLVAGVVPETRLAPLLAHLTDPNQFWRQVPVATLPADSPDFDPEGGYWHGSSWAPTTYMVIRGLETVGQHALAERLARQFYWCVAEVYKATGTFWENYAPDQVAPGNSSRRDFCGWTALVPITIWHDYIKG